MCEQNVKALWQSVNDRQGEFALVCSTLVENKFQPTDSYSVDRISLYEPEACGTTGRAYPVFERLLHAAYETIMTCQCEEGCPQCKIFRYHNRHTSSDFIANNRDLGVHYPQCSEQNLLCNKQGAIIILREILAKRI
jgi:ATP-dependent helicase YprA (DUF1998 family)